MQEQLSGGQQLVPTGLKNFAPVCSDLKISSSICAILLKSAHQRVGTFFYECLLFRYTQKKMISTAFFTPCSVCESIFHKKRLCLFFCFAQKITFLLCFSTLTQFARVPQIEPSWPQGSGHGASVRGCGKELISFSNHWQ